MTLRWFDDLRGPNNEYTCIYRTLMLPSIQNLNDGSSNKVLLILYHILMTFLVDRNEEFCNMCDELIAFSLPQHVRTNLQMLDQNLLQMRRGNNKKILSYNININMVVSMITTTEALIRDQNMTFN